MKRALRWLVVGLVVPLTALLLPAASARAQPPPDVSFYLHGGVGEGLLDQVDVVLAQLPVDGNTYRIDQQQWPRHRGTTLWDNPGNQVVNRTQAPLWLVYATPHPFFPGQFVNDLLYLPPVDHGRLTLLELRAGDHALAIEDRPLAGAGDPNDRTYAPPAPGEDVLGGEGTIRSGKARYWVNYQASPFECEVKYKKHTHQLRPSCSSVDSQRTFIGDVIVTRDTDGSCWFKIGWRSRNWLHIVSAADQCQYISVTAWDTGSDVGYLHHPDQPSANVGMTVWSSGGWSHAQLQTGAGAQADRVAINWLPGRLPGRNG